MRVLYAIQGTGNGHLSRARAVIPVLMAKKNIDLDILISGVQGDVDIPYPVKYKYKGLSFIFGKRGGVDLWKTYCNANLLQLKKEIKNLPVRDYDLVINDFEPVSAWACKKHNIPCVSFSHQAAVITKNAPKPTKKDPIGSLILSKYAPTTKQYGLHFKAYDNYTFTPIIRNKIRKSYPIDEQHYTVYLPAYSDQKLISVLTQVKDVKWQIFSKHCKAPFKQNNVTIQPINDQAFVKSLVTCTGVLCGAGFETPAEALFLNKKLLVIPMKNQYEQKCNAAALKEMGVPVLKKLSVKSVNTILEWVKLNKKVKVNYPDQTSQLIDQILTT